MLALFQQWWAELPGGAIAFLAILVSATAMLVRAGLHPTIFALVSWPGTTAHELAHGLVGLFLGAKPCSFSLLPKDMGNGQWQLGAVGFSNLRWWNAPWTALAPMLLAPLSVILTTEWAYPVWHSGDSLGGAWRLGLCVLFLQASWPSSTDLKIAAPGIAILAVLAIILW